MFKVVDILARFLPYCQAKVRDTRLQKSLAKTDEQGKLESEYARAHMDTAVNVFDVARFILRQTGGISAMKLQKLVYYAQAWSLVWDEAPLFENRIEAWANGPVAPDLYEYHRGMFLVFPTQFPGDIRKLNKTQKETISSVVDYYGDKSPQWLSDLTHAEEPWKKARAGLLPGERGSKEISLADMQEYYESL